MAYLPPVKLETHTSWFDILLTVLHEHAESDPYAEELGVYRNAIHVRKTRILKKLKKLLE